MYNLRNPHKLYVLSALALLLLLAFALIKNYRPFLLDNRVFKLCSQIEEVESITVKKSNRAQLLEKQGGVWYLRGNKDFPADPALVGHLLQTCKAVRILGVEKTRLEITQNPIEVSIRSGRREETWLILEAAGGTNQSFVQKGGEERMYLTDTNLKLPFSPDDFRDLNIARVDHITLKRIEIEQNGQQLLLEKNGTWKSQIPLIVNLNQEDMDSRIESYKILKAVGIYEGEVEELQNLVEKEVVLTSVDQEMKIHLWKNAEKNLFYLKKADQETIFLVSEDLYNSFPASFTELLGS